MMINEDYFIKYLKNELTEEETRQLIAWVKEKKENQDFLFSLKDSYVYLNYENDCKDQGYTAPISIDPVRRLYCSLSCMECF